MLIDGVSDLDWQMLDGVARLGITAGASVPELLIEQILDTLAEKYALSVDSVSAASEDGIFSSCRDLCGMKTRALSRLDLPLRGRGRLKTTGRAVQIGNLILVNGDDHV